MLRADTPTPSPTPGELDLPTRAEVESQWFDWFVGTPLRILLILVVGMIVLAAVRRIIRGVTNRLAREPRNEIGNVLRRVTPISAERRANRARTLGSVLRSTASIVIGSIILLLVLDELSINLAPLLASAGVAGVALGFGAQSLVKDFLSGTFLLFEDQYGVGDVVDFGTVTGTVESVALRVTKVRDADGTLWYIRNGEVLKVGNHSQGWSRAMAEIRVAYGSDVPLVRSLLRQAAEEVRSDGALNPHILAEPEVSGIEDLSGEALLFRVTVRCEAGQQVEVARALRLACLTALTDAGVELVGATRMTVVAPVGAEAGPSAASTAARTGATPSTTGAASTTEPTSD
ncbi:small conductance mechanosensitive channel [Flavimobilis soli]|uniref:Small conductance mechanosensitive channel n=1 Tax=Flavimobilis soli TaxID=442709 RepID=A0A2A9EAW8_9MICO|nr:mechanosensitive ion channel family protein [Flavimobilis soli]PFG36034.1 small conductance mechanosensitive channel [Flavimobilis soli]